MDFEFDTTGSFDTGSFDLGQTGFETGFDPAGYGFAPQYDLPGYGTPTFDDYLGYHPADSLEPTLDTLAPSWSVPSIPGLPSVEDLNQYVDNSVATTGFQLDQAIDQSNQFHDQLQVGIDTLNADGRFDDYLNQMDRQDAQMEWNYNQGTAATWAQTNAESWDAAGDRAEQGRGLL